MTTALPDRLTHRRNRQQRVLPPATQQVGRPDKDQTRHIHCCGHGGLWSRPYGGSLFTSFCRSEACPRWRLCWRCIFWTGYISIPAVTAAYGSALTAGHFWQTPRMPAQPKVTKRSRPWRTAFAPASIRGHRLRSASLRPPYDVLDYVEGRCAPSP